MIKTTVIMIMMIIRRGLGQGALGLGARDLDAPGVRGEEQAQGKRARELLLSLLWWLLLSLLVLCTYIYIYIYIHTQIVLIIRYILLLDTPRVRGEEQAERPYCEMFGSILGLSLVPLRVSLVPLRVSLVPLRVSLAPLRVSLAPFLVLLDAPGEYEDKLKASPVLRTVDG